MGFERLGLDEIVSMTTPSNVRSRRVMEKLGMRRQGRTRWRGSDMVWYAIDRSAWERNEEAATAAARQ